MFKKTVCIFLIAAVVFMFSSCTGSSEIYTDENGEEYIVVRDSDNNIVINDNGKLQVYVLNENGKKQKSDSGEYITEYIDFNGQVVEGNKVETAEMRFKLPSNFTQIADYPGVFVYDNYDGEIFINYYGNSEIAKDIENTERNCEDLLQSYGGEVFSYSKYTVTVEDTECTVFKQTGTSSEYYRNVYYYFIPFDDGYYLINCSVNTDYGNKVDFDGFVKSIEFK